MLVDYDAIGMRIKIARIRARISQETLAERTNWQYKVEPSRNYEHRQRSLLAGGTAAL